MLDIVLLRTQIHPPKERRTGELSYPGNGVLGRSGRIRYTESKSDNLAIIGGAVVGRKIAWGPCKIS